MSMKLKTPRSLYAYITTRSYKHYDTNKFLSNLECVPFHVVEFFNDFDDRVYAFNCLFLEALKAQSSQATNYTGMHTAFFAKKSNAKLGSRKWNMFDQSFEILMEILTPSGKLLIE